MDLVCLIGGLLGKELGTDPLRVRRRDRLAQVEPVGHPVDAHRVLRLPQLRFTAAVAVAGHVRPVAEEAGHVTVPAAPAANVPVVLAVARLLRPGHALPVAELETAVFLYPRWRHITLEHVHAQGDVLSDGALTRAGRLLQHIRDADPIGQLTRPRDELLVRVNDAAGAVALRLRVRLLARPGLPDQIGTEPPELLGPEFVVRVRQRLQNSQAVTQIEPVPRVAGLRLDVDADDIEAGPLKADGGAALAAADVERNGLVHRLTPFRCRQAKQSTMFTSGSVRHRWPGTSSEAEHVVVLGALRRWMTAAASCRRRTDGPRSTEVK